MLIKDYYAAGGDPAMQRIYLHTLALATAAPLNTYFATWLASQTPTLLSWAQCNPVEFSAALSLLETIKCYSADAPMTT